ncbi:hypothetical protein HY639_00990 [Candidatus Woesearchaeota archaeon]|nr:hypothetical protein [Candidatus Woesearchaeota archaeon]
MAVLEDAIRTLEQWGLMDILIPFMLVFTIIFSILLKIQILSKDAADNRRYAAIIALTLALAVIIPHSTNLYPSGSDPVVIINTSLPSIAAIMIALVMVLILIGSFGFGFEGGDIFKSVFAIVAFLTVLYIFGSSAGWFPYTLTGTFDYYVPPEVQSLIVILLVFGLIVSVIVGGGPKVDFWGGFKKGLEEFKVSKK